MSAAVAGGAIFAAGRIAVQHPILPTVIGCHKEDINI